MLLRDEHMKYVRHCEKFSVATSGRTFRGNPEFCYYQTMPLLILCRYKCDSALDSESEYQNNTTKKRNIVNAEQSFVFSSRYSPLKTLIPLRTRSNVSFFPIASAIVNGSGERSLPESAARNGQSTSPFPSFSA